MRGLLLSFALITSASAADFEKDVRPIFTARCSGCHGAGMQASGLRFDRKASVMRVVDNIVPRVTGAPGFSRMPPVGAPLSDAEIGILRSWVAGGAAWPDSADMVVPHWAFQPIRRVPTPAGSNPIDYFIRARLDREKIVPSPEASRTTLLRRVSLDLIGLPPTPDEVAAFLADDRPEAYERQVDRLLASPHFGEKWARYWLDLARYADSDGYEKDWVRPWAWRYRDWVIASLNSDKPFDQFTIEQIAGDLLPGATDQQRIATGFHRNTLTNREGGVDNQQFRFENTVDRASTVGTVWLGLTVGCAQCHNHKFDPISQKEFYQLFAFFDHVEEADIDAPRAGEWEPYQTKEAEYRAKRQQLLAEYRVPELQQEWERKVLGAAAEPGKWLDLDLAWDCVLKLTEGGDGGAILRKPAELRTQREQDVLTTHFVRNYHFAVGGKVYKDVKFKELDDKLTALKGQYPQLSQAMAIAEESDSTPSHLRVRGNYKDLGAEVRPGVPAVLPPFQGRTRLDLAKWIVSPQNPLTARVAVNRMWQELFGQGLVKTSDDFGTRGEAPSHPELLDKMASFFQEGWSVKRTLRLMVTSATYRQSSKSRPELDERDPENRLLARQARLRLPAELIRDEALAVSGLLSMDTVGGPSIRPPQPAGVTEIGYGNRAGSGWSETKGNDRYRRGLYIQFQRSTPYPELVTFDAPKSNVPVCKRERSNTALQALNLLNDPVFVEAGEALAKRVQRDAPPQFDPQLDYAFRLAVGRRPSPVEVAGLRKYWKRTASWPGLASVLLNLDEFITRE